MKPETRLDSATFQLTPTRTRCDLIIKANGQKEKIASGLLNPFLAHLKVAQDQIAKGGYSIVLEPSPGSSESTAWFTKNTIERFVRFVSTPEVLERVHTIESEIIQIDEAIVIQSNETLGLSTVEEHPVKLSESNEASNRCLSESEAEKAIVLYKPDMQPPETKQPSVPEENSKVKLLKVLETRKKVLQKEQGMAFARAVAAGFDVEHMDDLSSFAECFGASRLRDACGRFVDLWTKKHVTRQWLERMEAEAAEVLSSQSDLQEVWRGINGDISGDKARALSEIGSDANMPDRDKMFPMDNQAPQNQRDYFQGQFQQPMYPQWPVHPSQGPPMYPPYPMPGMPYYPGYPGSGQFFPQPYQQMDDPRFTPTHKRRPKKKAVSDEDEDEDEGSDSGETNISNGKSHDSTKLSGHLEAVKDDGHESHKISSRRGKKRSGMVVIRNINYITSEKQKSGEGDSDSGAGTEEELEDVLLNLPRIKHKSSVKPSGAEKNRDNVHENWEPEDLKDASENTDIDNGHWQAFQSLLLKNEDDQIVSSEKNMFHLDSQVRSKRQHNAVDADSIFPNRNASETTDHWTAELDMKNVNVSRVNKLKAPNNEGLAYEDGSETRDKQDIIFAETEFSSRRAKGLGRDDFVMYGHNLKGSIGSRLDPITGNEIYFEGTSAKNQVPDTVDESFIVPERYDAIDQVDRNGRTVMGMDSEFLSGAEQYEESSKSKYQTEVGYEPDDLSMLPERVHERSYNLAIDYDMQIEDDVSFNGNGNIKPEDVPVSKEEAKVSEKRKKGSPRESMDKRRADALMKKGRPSKLSPLAEAQARADRLRAFKADLQKSKKEQEEAQIRRLEALKRERQQRIAAKSVQSPTQVRSSVQPARARGPVKLSPSSLKSSKFSDSEIGPTSPIPKLTLKSSPLQSDLTLKGVKSSNQNGSQTVRSVLSKSVSSLPEATKGSNNSQQEVTVSERLRRLSEPKIINGSFTNSSKNEKGAPAKSRSSDEMKKNSLSAKHEKTKTPTSENQGTKMPPFLVSNKVNSEKVAGLSDQSPFVATGEQDKKLRGDDLADEMHVPVVDKNVLTFEHDISLAPIANEVVNGLCDDNGKEENFRRNSQLVSSHSPPLVTTTSNNCHDGSNLNLVGIQGNGNTSQIPKVAIDEKTYQAPIAQVTSFEDTCANSPGYSKASQLISESAFPLEAVKVHIPESTKSIPLEETQGISEKAHNKDSSKGFKRLLKFGRRSHSSATEQLADSLSSDSSAVSVGSASDSSSLKNLISKDSGRDGSHNGSRSFSLLSPFRSKAGEKRSS